MNLELPPRRPNGQGASEGLRGPGLLVAEPPRRRRRRRRSPPTPPPRRPARPPATPTASRPRPRRSRSCTCRAFRSVARSTSPGRPPPTLRITSCRARPMVALARLPCPKALIPEFIPMARPTGPLTTRTGPTNQVVASTPCMLNSSVHTASTAARTTGRYSGRHPAMTALIATFSTVTGARLGERSPPPRRALGRCRPAWPGPGVSVGGTTGSRRSSPGPTWPPARPPARPGAPAGTGAQPGPEAHVQRARLSPGSRCREPQPGR